MTPVDINQVLAQMRALASQAGNQSAQATTPPQMDFGALLTNSINRVNDMQQKAETMASAFETGAKDVDIAQVMVEVQKASLAFRAMTEVRNKLVQAYQDVMNMPLYFRLTQYRFGRFNRSMAEVARHSSSDRCLTPSRGSSSS